MRVPTLGYSYNALADEVQAATARVYLEQPDIAMVEVAYLLGPADQSSFNRAYKRWTGHTPARSRALFNAHRPRGHSARIALSPGLGA